MKSSAACPDRDSLQELLAGVLSDEEETRLERHVWGCRCCQESLDRLSASTWEEEAKCLGTQRVAEPRLQQLMTNILAERPTCEAPEFADQTQVCGDAPDEESDVPVRLGPYRILKTVGSGGFGQVFRAHDEKLERIVAVKIMRPGLAGSAASRRRFLREAKAAAAVCHDHIVGIHAVDEHDGRPFIVMPFVDGVSLQERLDRGGPLDLAEILRVGMQTAAGLAAAHGQGLIHRDIKPSNILLENGSARVKITDFGLARAVDDTSLSQRGVLVGTPEYMAPEQARGEDVDHRADLFSLGGVLFALATGAPPFSGRSTPAVLKKVCDDPHPSLSTLNPRIPDWLAAIVHRLLAKDPAARFQSAAEVAELLAQHLAQLGKPGGCSASSVGWERRQPGTTQGLASLGPAPRKRRRFSSWPNRAAAVLLLSALGAAYFWGPAVYRFATDQGLVVVETTGEDVEVTVKGKDVVILDTKTGKQVTVASGKYSIELTDKDRGLQLSTTEFTLERGGKQIVRVRVEPGVVTRTLRQFRHTEPAHALAFADKGRLLSGGWDHTVRWWDVESGKQLQLFNLKTPGNNFAVYCVAVFDEGRRGLAGSRDGRVWLLDLESGKVLKHCDHPRSAPKDGFGVNSLAITRDGKRALLGSYDGVVRDWDLEEWKELRRFKHSFGLWSVDCSADAKLALTAGGSDKEVHLAWWDLSTFKELHRNEGGAAGKGGFWRAVFSPDGLFAASAEGEGTVRLWDAATGKHIRAFPHPDQVQTVCFSVDGRRIISGCNDGIVRIWDAHSGREVWRFVGHDKGVHAVAVSPDGRYVASGAADKTVCVWELPWAKK